MLAETKSKRGKSYVEVFVTNFGWLHAFPMAKRGDAYESLSLLFQQYGVPPKIIVDGSKVQTQGYVRRKVAEAGCHLRHMETESLWQMAAEGGIHEINRGSERKMTKIKSAKVLWDNCLELEAYNRSNTDLDIFELDRVAPETKMSGETSNINTFCKFLRYQGFYFRDTYLTFPGDKLVLGRYCGPSIDVWPALTANIMKNNSQQVHKSTYRSLKPD